MKVGILTYGCSANRADTEIMGNLLSEFGYEVEYGSEDVDILIINTCIVKGPTENRILRKLQDLRGRKVIVSGCMPQAYDVSSKFPDFAFMGTNSINIVDVLQDYLHGMKPMTTHFRSKAGSKRLRSNPYVEVIPIAEGCLGSCSYCAVKLARGDLKSHPQEEIIKSVERSVSQGVKEIWLTSQDNGCYGFDTGTNLAELLNKIVAAEGDFRVRVGMMNPNFALEMLKPLIEVYKNEKIYNFLHIPLQSGSDKVLSEMNRKYTVEEFKKVIDEFRKGLDVSISTDIIVGYPTETREDFEHTLRLVKELRPENINISRFWPRRGTNAGKMKQLPVKEVKKRGMELSKAYKKISGSIRNGWNGWHGTVLFTEKENKDYIGRNYRYVPVVVNSRDELRGSFRNVKIIKVGAKIRGTLSDTRCRP